MLRAWQVYGKLGGQERNINLGMSQMLTVFGSGQGRDGLWEGPMSNFLTRPGERLLDPRPWLEMITYQIFPLECPAGPPN